ncbi:hypothetical protein CUZ56_01769 [Saezia sanguinis]|uniref:Uncharacterized protein n=1 Tax=Saezia sanguinis TaxID=1965230 RepID=A0A433SCN4_9BURK|nr:hypothetical protein [Saezia sanguinis]RUS66489.1 hypothetical protein CUZ56_01769 [Saezia sanguinis]
MTKYSRVAEVVFALAGVCLFLLCAYDAFNQGTVLHGAGAMVSVAGIVCVVVSVVLQLIRRSKQR